MDEEITTKRYRTKGEFVLASASDRRSRRLAAAVVAANLSVLAFPAFALAAPNGTISAEVNVEGAIELTNLSSGFTLSGVPNETVATNQLGQSADITMKVLTNNATGYEVEISPVGTDLTNGANVIPFATLQVADVVGGTPGTFQPVVANTVVHQTTAPSVAGGDVVTNRYQITIPAVLPGPYTGTIDYLATVKPGP
jgi:hypothetical protein